jgi:predicted HicB family RNase H-like nuclease
MNKSKLLKYKEYLGSVDYDLESGVLYGKIQFINDIVTYEALSLPEIKVEFEIAVKDYLETCAAIGKEPQKAYSGTFNVRVGEELHREAVICSMKKGMNLNELCCEAIAEKVDAIKMAETEKEPVVQINLIDPAKVGISQSDNLLSAQYLAFSTAQDAEERKPELQD